MLVLLENCNLLDTANGILKEDYHILIEDKIIKEVNDKPINISAELKLNLKGKTVMPGLCDAHVHITAIEVDLTKLKTLPVSYITARSIKIAEAMLKRGFTTVRDAGGADWGLAKIFNEAIFDGPRLLFCGHALSQTGGHGDLRNRADDVIESIYPSLGSLGRICDGVSEVRKAARDELRKGATHLKIMASGGVASPTDPVEATQFSIEEIKAIVEEAEAVNSYVMAHAYTSKAIKRALDCGIRSIEHGNLIDEDTLDFLILKKAFLVPTLATYEMFSKKENGVAFTEDFLKKAGNLREKSLTSLELAYKKGAKIAFGTDLLGYFHKYQSIEFELRRQIMKPADIIRSATTVCAELFKMENYIGEIKPQAYADLLVITGNPLEDITLLQIEKNHIKAIMKEGKFIVNNL
ncbi:MAG: amidohydrolase family protein [Thermodesulfovibrionales bacterium]|nr:amidohydrolase family protein [Thermodesulfovibrionales bacterium]